MVVIHGMVLGAIFLLSFAGGLAGIPATANQQFNTLDRFYMDATAHLVQGFVHYNF
jgi:hypothetical protein